MRVNALSQRHGSWVCMLLVAVGLAGSAYLLGRAFAAVEPPRPGARDLCSAFLSTGCGEALADERTWILGVPIAGWGLVYFAALGGLLFLARFVGRAFETEALLAATLLTLAGLGVGLALTASALLGHAPMCPLCVSLHAVSLLLLFALQRAHGRSLPGQLRLLRLAWDWLLRSGAGTPEPVRWKLVGLGSVALLASVAFQWVYVESALRRPRAQREPDRAAVFAAYRSSPPVALPVSGEDPHLGPLDAPVRLVVFGSFRCSGCRRFAGTISRLRERYRDRLLIVYKHYPLSTACNQRLATDLQPGACEIAWAAEAANRQARFWPFHDALLAAGGDPDPGSLEAMARRLQLDPARFTSDRRSDSTRHRVAEDVALGNRLKIPGTPAVYLEGRLVRSASPGALEMLIRDELRRRVTGSRRNGRAITGLGRPAVEDRPSKDG